MREGGSELVFALGMLLSFGMYSFCILAVVSGRTCFFLSARDSSTVPAQ